MSIDYHAFIIFIYNLRIMWTNDTSYHLQHIRAADDGDTISPSPPAMPKRT